MDAGTKIGRYEAGENVMISSLGMSVLALLASIVTAISLRRRLRRIDSMVKRRDKLAAAVKEQSQYIRKTARQTLNLRRSYKVKARVRERLEEKAEEIKGVIKSINEIDCRVHVLDDRKTKLDLTWIAVIKHNDFKNQMLPGVNDDVNRQWRIGYRFVIWAPDKERAMDKIDHRYPAIGGFLVTSIEQNLDN